MLDLCSTSYQNLVAIVITVVRELPASNAVRNPSAQLPMGRVAVCKPQSAPLKQGILFLAIARDHLICNVVFTSRLQVMLCMAST